MIEVQTSPHHEADGIHLDAGHIEDNAIVNNLRVRCVHGNQPVHYLAVFMRCEVSITSLSNQMGHRHN